MGTTDWNVEWVSGAGNRFVLVRCDLARLGEDAAAAARRLVAEARAHGAPWTPDGLLVLAPGHDGADGRMVLFNADGSRPEACGNGLRCVAHRLARDEGRADIRIETDAGPRRASVDLERNAVTAEMGPVRLVAPRLEVQVAGRTFELAHVDVGNPHAVLLDEDADLSVLGPALQDHAAFPDGVNVGLARVRADGLELRVHERGVGETLACGTGAAAAAFVAHERRGLAYPLRVSMPGGELVVLERDGRLFQTGRVEVEGRARVEPGLPAAR